MKHKVMSTISYTLERLKTTQCPPCPPRATCPPHSCAVGAVLTPSKMVLMDAGPIYLHTPFPPALKVCSFATLPCLSSQEFCGTR